jgi:hypothetical protein
MPIVAGGAAIGLAVTYFSAHSVTAASLTVGALFGLGYSSLSSGNPVLVEAPDAGVS